MSNLNITIILDKKDRTLPKPFNNRPGYDMNYVASYVSNYTGFKFNELFDTERLYDNLSIVRNDENLIQWAVRVRIDLQELLIKQKFSVYHNFCLFASYPGGKLENFNYYRPKPFKNGTAICFGCWKVIRANVNIKPRKIFHYSRRRFVDIVEPRDLMIDHWDHECDKPKTDFGRARIIQRAWRNFKKSPGSSLAKKVWNAVRNDDTPNEEKFLGITTRKVKNLQTRDQFNLRRNNLLITYKEVKNEMMYFSYYIEKYEEYYIPGDWISFKKHQLQQRLMNHLKGLLKEQGYRVVCARSWYVMVKWIENPDYYANLTYPNIVRI